MSKKFFIIITVGILTFACFQIYSKLYISHIRMDKASSFVGTYQIEHVNRVDQLLLLKRNYLKGAYFEKSKNVLYLKEDFSQRYVIYKEKNNTVDSLVCYGTWKISDESIHLNFPNDSIHFKLLRMGYSDKFYTQSNLYDCKERTREIGKHISLYKKVK